MSDARGYPVQTSSLAAYLPHRPPMVWVDEVVNTDETSGLCRVRFNPKATYCDDNGVVRRTSFIEWMAQSYGYALASRVWLGIDTVDQLPKQTFLAQMRDVCFFDDIATGLDFFIETKTIKTLGALSLVQARVLSADGHAYATAELKLFAQ